MMNAVRAVLSVVAATGGVRSRVRPRAVRRAAAALSLVACLPAVAAQAVEQSWSGRGVLNVVRFETLPVGDVEGHAVGLYENRGAMLHDDGRVGQVVTRGTFDLAAGVLTYQGYMIVDYEDGSRLVGEVRGTYDTTAAEPVDRGTVRFTEGAGLLESLEGQGAYEGRPLSPVESGGTVLYDWTATATLPD